MNGIRAFIAVELPPEVRVELSRVQLRLRSASACPAKWVEPGSIHLTLCFLGEIGPAQVDAVKGVMAGVTPEVQPFTLEFTQAGAFPNLRQPQTLWVGLKGALDILSSLHKRLEEGLRTTDYKPEDRPFRPHLTLARVRDEATPSERQGLGEAVGRLSDPIAGRIDVSEINLMKSQLSPSGAVYSRLFSSRLG